jgi:hypothetical protein
MKTMKNSRISAFLLVSVIVFMLGSFSLAFGGAPAASKDDQVKISGGKYEAELLIDNFDDGDIKTDPTWWTFDRIKLTFKEANDNKYGNYFLKINGKAESYYVGGMGTYVGKDAAKFDTFLVSVYGSGPNSGVIRFQVYDDDNNTYQLEQDSTYQPLYDDFLEYELKVDWEGWRTIEIPLARFVDMNQGVGDDVWNPDQKDGSGGLLHVQYVVVASSANGDVNIGIDNIKLVKKN